MKLIAFLLMNLLKVSTVLVDVLFSRPGCLIETGVYICSGNNVRKLELGDGYGELGIRIRNGEMGDGQKQCAMQCALTKDCVVWTFHAPSALCYLKSDDNCKGTEFGWITGNKDCGTSKYLY